MHASTASTTTTTYSTPIATPPESWHSDDLVMLIGASRTGQLLEIGVSHADGIDFIIQAIPARAKFIR